MQKVAVIGGDERQLYIADYLKTKGYDLSLYALDSYCKNDFADKISECSYVVLPMSVSDDGEYLNTPLSNKRYRLSDIASMISDCKIVFSGKTDYFNGKIKGNIFNYVDDEVLLLKNAVLTSEAVLDIIIKETKMPIFGSNCLVIGSGRLAKALSVRLKHLGAKILVMARNRVAMALFENESIETENIIKLKSTVAMYDCIINTVPATVVTKDVIENINNTSLIIDLASKPGGIDFEYAAEKGIKTVRALGLPGKYFPKTAGKIIGQTVERVIRENIYG